MITQVTWKFLCESCGEFHIQEFKYDIPDVSDFTLRTPKLTCPLDENYDHSLQNR